MAQLKITYNDWEQSPSRFVYTYDANKFAKDCVAEFKRELRKKLRAIAMYESEITFEEIYDLIKKTKVKYEEKEYF